MPKPDAVSSCPGPLEEIPVVLLPGSELGGVDTDPCMFLIKLVGAYSLLWSHIDFRDGEFHAGLFEFR